MPGQARRNLRGDLVLQVEYVIERSLQFFRPNHSAAGGFDKFGRNPDTLVGPANTASNDVFNRDLAGKIFRPGITVPKHEGRMRIDYEKFAVAAQVGDDVLGKTVRKIVTILRFAQVFKR